MKVILTILCIFTLLITNAQTTTLAEIEKQVKIIRTQFQKTNTSSTTKKVFNWSKDACGQGELKFYFLNQQLVKIIEFGFIGDGSWTKEYYYQNKVYFTYEVFNSYIGAGSNETKKDEYRSYFYNDKLIRSIENGIVKNYTQQNTVLTQTAKEYRLFNSFKSKKFNEAICQ